MPLVLQTSNDTELHKSQEQKKSSCSDKPTSATKYGELCILGYNGCIPTGDRGRRRSKFVLSKRSTANGVKRLKQYAVESPRSTEAFTDSKQHTISYVLSKNEAVIVEYTHDENTDMFQIGRSSETPIDFVVMDTIPGNKAEEKKLQQSTVSRFACRIVCDRADPSIVRVYAACFDSSRNIFLGEKAIKWKEGDEIDGLTTNGVLILHLEDFFCDGEAKTGLWREVSVEGGVFSLRGCRSSSNKGLNIPDETNILRDGTLIDLCGATLLWRSAEGLAKSPTKQLLETLVEELNPGRPIFLSNSNTIHIPRSLSQNNSDDKQKPYVYVTCGHVQGHKRVEDKHCPICLKKGPVVKLCMGIEPAFYVDAGPPNFAYSHCGHMATEKTIKYWANVGIPHGISGFEAECPFCASPLVGSPGYVRLTLQDGYIP